MINQIATNLFRFLLLPLSLLWESIYRLRRFAYNYDLLKSEEFVVPVISVGNLTFGGTGKTPFSLWLATYLSNAQKRTMILMRGYKGELEHSHGILRSEARLLGNPQRFGDEALMLTRRMNNGSVVVGKRRADNLKYYFNQDLPDVVVLDDGHQHLKIRRNLSIVLFDSTMPLLKYRCPPLGYLREGMSALRDADIVVLGRADQVPTERLEQIKNFIKDNVRKDVVFASISYVPIAFLNQQFQRVFSVEQIRDIKVILAAGIASPLPFFKQVEALGATVIDRLIFPDHHDYSVEELRGLLTRLEEEDAYMVVTEKDMVKIRRKVNTDRIIYMEIDISFLSGFEGICEKINTVM